MSSCGRDRRAPARASNAGSTVAPGAGASCAGCATASTGVTVRSVGPEGWVELGEGVAARWRTEVALPETTLTEFPSTTARRARFAWTVSEPSTSECRWDGGAWEQCGVSGAERVLAAGPHTFEVRAVDGLGRREASPERWSWTITADAAARAAEEPIVTIVSGPPDRTDSTTATFVFASSVPGSTFTCDG